MNKKNAWIPASAGMTHKKEPRVSVVMTAFNAARYINEAVVSIMRQTYPNIKLIIVDDASTDTTWKKIRSLAKKYKRISAYRMKTNGGPSEASNFGIAKATGKYIARMDADDVAYPRRIEIQVNFMEHHPSVAIAGGQCDVINEHGDTIGEKTFPTTHDAIMQSLFTINPIQHPSWIIRRALYRKARIMYERRYHVSHDLKILFRMIPYGKFANVPETILQYRHRPGSVTHTNPKLTFSETSEIRHWALKTGVYQPTITGLLMHITQSILVRTLPNQTINALFLLWRLRPIDEMKKAAKLAVSTSSHVALVLIPAIIGRLFFADVK